MSHPDTEQTYQALRRAIMRAQQAGVRIVCETNDVIRDGAQVGVCAISALRNYGTAEERMLLRREWRVRCAEAISVGFDGLHRLSGSPGASWYAWYQVGLRLRDEFSPITATELERELGATS